MYERAMDKLRDEIAAAKDEAVRQVGEMTTMALEQDPALAETGDCALV